MPDELPPDLVQAIPASRRRHFHYVAEIDSTNDRAMALAGDGAPEGTAVLAEAQRAGRGRRGRDWFSPPGAGLYLSVVIRPAAREEWTLVTIAAGVAAARAVAGATGLPLELKWPNDLVVGRPWRKVGGVLCESVGSGARVDAVVVGIGLNLRHAAYPPEIAARATAIETELGRGVDRGAIVAALLEELDEVVGRLRAGDRAGVCDAWRRLAASGLHGAPVRWHDQGRDRTGIVRGLDDDGALVVAADGRLVRIVSGEVTWERLSRD
jgi:BirA family biotin operon repressor/biotin-[acetyl-CoA-carboxylase] ligase